MKPSQLFLLLTLFLTSGCIAHAFFLGNTVYGDGRYYFAWLTNTVVNHHIDTTMPAIKYSIGPAIFWAPGFLAVHSVLRGSGVTFPYQLIVALMSVGYTMTGLLLLYRILSTQYSTFISTATIVAIAGATNLLFYGSVDTVNSHALSFFAVSLFLSLVYTKQHIFWIGVALGCIALIRPQDIIVLFLTPLNFLLVTSGMLTFSPQLIVWYMATGSLVSPYLTGTEGFNFLHPHVLQVLFSKENGLFLWTPITALGVVGLWKRYRTIFFIFILQIYLVSCWSSWNQGASYSGRMFVGELPLLAFGIAYLFKHVQQIRIKGPILYLMVIAPLSVINMLSMLWFLWKNP